ncbi:NAD(P)H-binding protein [Alloprevotella tannerae]|uniref:NAD(P)-dependent oxidoreductase n=1 Tax=Alloprevotella tannerae TaxID=76122 RepID=UPI0028EBE10B|nr:NAD(P)H-binding protein [Alloprevotella tannerae]
MKKVVLIGATGMVGAAILKELLSRNYEVKAVVRNVSKLPVDERITPVEIDVADAEVLAEAMRGADVVISAYNPGWANPDIVALTDANYPKILAAAKQSGVGRLLIVGGAGTLFVAPGLRVVDSGVIPDEIIGAVRALGNFYLDVLLAEKAIDWVFFSPAGTFDAEGKRTGTYRLGKDDLIVDAEGNSHISVADYAKAMVDELETPQHHQERFTIGY